MFSLVGNRIGREKAEVAVRFFVAAGEDSVGYLPSQNDM